jgi:hypothetical protein
MNEILSALVLATTRIFDFVVAPFGSHRTSGLLVLSLLAGAALTLLYRALADEARIRRSREVFKARVLEMRLYPDDLALITRALFGAMAAQGAYLRAAARPILIVALLAIPVFIQIEARYARAPLAPGDETLVTARLKQGLDVRSVPTSLAPAGGAAPAAGTDATVRIDPRSVRAAAAGEVTWRVKSLAPGRPEIAVQVYDQRYRFRLCAQSDGRAIGHERRSHSFAGALTDIGLPTIGRDSPIDGITVNYPAAHYRILGLRMSWLGVFALATLVGASVPAILLKVAL